MTTKQKIGMCMLASPFIGLFIFGWIDMGFMAIATIYIGTAALYLFISVSVDLLCSDEFSGDEFEEHF